MEENQAQYAVLGEFGNQDWSSEKPESVQETENNHDFAERGEDVAQEGLQLMGSERWAVCQQTAGASHVPEAAWVGAEAEGEDEEVKKKKEKKNLRSHVHCMRSVTVKTCSLHAAQKNMHACMHAFGLIA